jgi:hypothetical protein
MIVVLKYVRKIGFLGCSEMPLVRSRHRGIPSTKGDLSAELDAKTLVRRVSYRGTSCPSRAFRSSQRQSGGGK